MMIFISSGSSMDVTVSQLLVRGVHEYVLSVPSYSFYEPTAKIPKTGALDKTADYTMKLAKNESEYCQIAFQMRLNRSNLALTCTDFTDENGNTLETSLFEEYYIKTTGETIMGSCPDPLVPVTADYKFSALGCSNYPFVIRVRTTADTPAGDYTATISLTSTTQPDNKYENLSVTVHAHVWDFVLPDAPSMDTAMGLGKGDIARAHRVDVNSEAASQLYKNYYEFLLEHKISAYNLPVDILSDEADAYMSDPRCTSFCIPYGSDEQIRAYYEKLSTNEEWLNKAYFYPIDEPTKQEDYDRYNSICARLASLYPDYNMVTPFYVNTVELDDGTHYSVDLQNGKSSIMCPETVVFDGESFSEKAWARQKNGDKLWWYVCCGPSPTSDYCNLFVQQDGIKHRLLFWQQKQYNVTGLLYWCTNWWGDVVDSWSSAHTTPWTGADTFGDGNLMYDGYRLGQDFPASSLRLEAVTNGIEDYEYLTIAEDLFGRDYVDGVIAKVSKDLTHYTLFDAQFAKVRAELGSAIEKAFG
ncbi:MAG: DUF4091 domain-containing protein [Clostridia bacterium]|nr:DUF4091 domain-containing protein [Clostridia bacterium]